MIYIQHTSIICQLFVSLSISSFVLALFRPNYVSIRVADLHIWSIIWTKYFAVMNTQRRNLLFTVQLMFRVTFHLRVRPPIPTRNFIWGAARHASQQASSKPNDSAISLDKSPIVQAVSRRMHRRSELQSKVS